MTLHIDPKSLGLTEAQMMRIRWRLGLGGRWFDKFEQQIFRGQQVVTFEIDKPASVTHWRIYADSRKVYAGPFDWGMCVAPLDKIVCYINWGTL